MFLNLEVFFGTAFFINQNGAFITAGHVLKDLMTQIDEKGGSPGLVLVNPEDRSKRYLGEILNYSYADEPYDIAVGIVKHVPKAYFELLNPEKIWIWQDVQTLGYPQSAMSMEGERVRSDVQGLKGYILRKLPQGNVLMKEHPISYELSFPIPIGLSGAPLVIRFTDLFSGELAFPLLAVCVGSHQTELVDFSYEEVEESGTKFKEKKVKIIEYGIAHDLWSLKDWEPKCLEGKTLKESITQ